MTAPLTVERLSLLPGLTCGRVSPEVPAVLGREQEPGRARLGVIYLGAAPPWGATAAARGHVSHPSVRLRDADHDLFPAQTTARRTRSTPSVVSTSPRRSSVSQFTEP